LLDWPGLTWRTEDTEEIEAELAIQTDAERAALESLINALEGMSDDPKLRAIRYYLAFCAQPLEKVKISVR
jgi:hypothetical protein